MIQKNLKDYQTAYKYGKPVLEGSGRPGTYNSLAVDCPFVFWHNGTYYMLHVGFDGKRYQTALSTSSDLLHWSEGKVILPREDANGWDKVGVAGLWILKENELDKLPALKKVNGKYWMVYHSYPNEGYEAGSAQIGLAYTEDENLLEWKRLDEPILSWKDGEMWEQGGLYKGCLIEENNVYYLFYNAKQKDEEPWNEQIGVAVSTDLIHWKRGENNPVIGNSLNGWDSRFCADPYIVKDKEQWVMFYYGYDGETAEEGIAFSKDLLHWEKAEPPVLCHGKEDDLDRYYAHKPSVLMADGILYHFYCAVRGTDDMDKAINISTVPGESAEYRCITVACNKNIF